MVASFVAISVLSATNSDNTAIRKANIIIPRNG